MLTAIFSNTEFGLLPVLEVLMRPPLYVTRPLLPDLAELNILLESVWASNIITNIGPLHQKLEQELRQVLGVPTAMLFNNGTIALLAALKLFKLPAKSEVITTPLTFAATAHAIDWNGLVPVFVDVLPETLTIDPAAVELAITDKTSAILGVHVYGNVCELDALQRIADRHGLKLLYDAAHAFGTTVDGTPIASFGDGSAFSFHATKLFNTVEGGLLATKNPEDANDIYFLRNFGIKNEEEVVSIGINGKLNEMQAAVGILNLALVDEERRQRSVLREKYLSFLSKIDGVLCQPVQPGVSNSEQYFPIQIDAEIFGRSRDDIYEALKLENIFARKYFHPICTDFEPYRDFKTYSVHNMPYVETVKTRVLCLPFHSGVTDEDLKVIERVFLAT